MKRLFLFVFLLVFTLLLVACGNTAGGEDDSYRVMVSFGEGVTLEGENPVEVKAGESVNFKIKVDSNYDFVSVSHGVYNEKTGTLTIENVNEKMNVSFNTKKLDYDKSETVVYRFNAEKGDSSEVTPGDVNLGTYITLTSNNRDKLFLGWSIGESLDGGGAIVSEERVYEIRVTPDILKNGVLYVYANYREKNTGVYYYHPNGGEVNASSDNVSSTKYYKAEFEGELLKVSMSDDYTRYASSVSTFYDDGSFYRPGYVLIEYNTKADGSGESYSIGSKFYAMTDDEKPTLYCIWRRVSNVEDFTYESYNYARPVKESYAPDWIENGIIITGYIGNDECLVIPEEINGQKVIAIKAGAIKNKSFKTLVLNRRIQKVEDGAFISCSSLETIYYPDGIYSISNAAFDADSYRKLTKLYVNASIAPRFANTSTGSFGLKLSRLLEYADSPRLIVIAGSSSYEGLATEYMEALLSNKYTVINFGTTRTTHGYIYLEAMSHYANSSDIVLYAPENSTYMMGEPELYWKTLRDLEGMNNFFRYIDISKYTNVFTAFADLNQNYRYKRAESRYEDMILYAKNTSASSYTNKYGDYMAVGKDQYDSGKYIDSYFITLNERYKSKYDTDWNDESSQKANKDYKDPANKTWQSITDSNLKNQLNRAIASAKSSGAKVYFAHAPMDAYAVVEEARNLEWIRAYDKLIADTYDFDAVIGKAENYIFDHNYFYDCAFHVNDYGRVYRTYQLYLDLADIVGVSSSRLPDTLGTDFEGCEFEKTDDGRPLHKVDFLN